MNVLITGAGRGIGNAVAELFVSRGYDVFSNFNKTKPKFGIPIQADVSSEPQVKTMFENLPPIGLLINNAGVSLTGVFQDITESDFKRLFEVNVYGVFNCCKYAAMSMLRRQNGHIINIASIWGEVGGSLEAHYSASKGAVIAFSKALAKELEPSGIKVDFISPPAVDTDMCKELTIEKVRPIVIAQEILNLTTAKC